ncbi:MAG: transcriptional regulator [Candidatus Krumholzibacteriia bacterium]
MNDSSAALPPADAPLPELLHSRGRLLILCQLARSGALPFTELRALLGMTDGTLSVHLARLEEGGVVALEKGFVGKRPRTVVRLTGDGARRFGAYVQDLRRLVPGLAD